jgi:hypothetical protein
MSITGWDTAVALSLDLLWMNKGFPIKALGVLSALLVLINLF